MTVIALASLIVVTEYANLVDDIGQSIFEAMYRHSPSYSSEEGRGIVTRMRSGDLV